MHDFAGDALAAVDFLAARSEIDPQQIGLHGTSAGGWVAVIVATRTKIPLAFIITSVGPADSVRNQQIHVAQYSMRRRGLILPRRVPAAAGIWGWSRLCLRGQRVGGFARFCRKAKQTSGHVSLTCLRWKLRRLVWVRLNRTTPPGSEKDHHPFPGSYGGAIVVPPEENIGKLERYLTQAGNRDFKIVVFPGADHGLTIPSQLRRIGSERPEKYYWLWRKRAPGVVETTVDWLLQHIKPRRPS